MYRFDTFDRYVINVLKCLVWFDWVKWWIYFPQLLVSLASSSFAKTTRLRLTISGSGSTMALPPGSCFSPRRCWGSLTCSGRTSSVEVRRAKPRTQWPSTVGWPPHTPWPPSERRSCPTCRGLGAPEGEKADKTARQQNMCLLLVRQTPHSASGHCIKMRSRRTPCPGSGFTRQTRTDREKNT